MSGEVIYRVAHAGWTQCTGQQAADVPAWPRLTHSALVVLDLDDVFSDVWRFEGKSEYATALIEKRVRTQGLVEGAAHIVIHRLIKLPGGFQAFFSAISLEFWQRCSQWAQEQGDHCLVLTAAGLLCHGVDAGHARIILSQRRLMGFFQTEEGMSFSSTQALGSGPAAMASAAQVLAGNQSALLARMGPEAVQWCTLWSTQPGDSEICRSAMHGVLTGRPQQLPSVDLVQGSERIETALPMLAWQAAGRHALNPLVQRVAWRAERWVAPITVVTALAGVALLTLGVLLGQLADRQREEGQAQRTELAALQDRIQTVVSVEAPQKLLPVADFSRLLDEGSRYDPMAFMAVLKASASKDIQIQRVRLETSQQARSKAFRVDGVVAQGASASVTRWVGQMMAAGWSLRALDPADTGPGAFSYELVATAGASRSVKP